jgi:hypothetical protein
MHSLCARLWSVADDFLPLAANSESLTLMSTCASNLAPYICVWPIGFMFAWFARSEHDTVLASLMHQCIMGTIAGGILRQVLAVYKTSSRCIMCHCCVSYTCTSGLERPVAQVTKQRTVL